MAVAQSLTVSRTTGDLVITNAVPTSSTDFSIPEEGLAFPDFDVRISLLDDADDLSGSVLKAYSLGAGVMPLVLEVHGTSMADLQANRRTLEQAFYRDSYDLTLSIGGETETYPAFPAWPKWGTVRSGLLRELIAVATLSVTVNPMSADSSSSSSES